MKSLEKFFYTLLWVFSTLTTVCGGTTLRKTKLGIQVDPQSWDLLVANISLIGFLFSTIAYICIVIVAFLRNKTSKSVDVA